MQPSGAAPPPAPLPPHEHSHSSHQTRAPSPPTFPPFLLRPPPLCPCPRTDFKKNTLTKVEALTSWFSSAIADSSLYQRLNARDEGWAGGGWLSRLARHQLAHASHFSVDQKRQVVRLVSLVSAYSVHDPQTGYCQG